MTAKPEALSAIDERLEVLGVGRQRQGRRTRWK